MASNLQIGQDINATAQSVKDQNGNTSQLTLSIDKVGIGTTNPETKLDVKGGAVSISNPSEGALLLRLDTERPWEFRQLGTGQNTALELASVGGGGNKNFIINTSGRVGIGTTNPEANLAIKETADGASQIVSFNLFPTNAVFQLDVGGDENSKARIHLGDLENADNPVTMLGNVGIGTKSPKEKLHVDGNIMVTGDVKFIGADCAEDFDIVGEKTEVTPGTVMVINDDGQLCHSNKPYDTTVAGVVSGAGDYKPGIVLGKSTTNRERVPIALIGKVFCKVDANYAPIRVGDLLTTSPTPGYAMKVIDPLSAFGAVIGKALCAVTSGQTLIPILIALQ